METTRADRFKTAILLIAGTSLIAGLAFYVTGQPGIANLIWIAGVVPALAALVVEILPSIGISLPRCPCRRHSSSTRPSPRRSSR